MSLLYVFVILLFLLIYSTICFYVGYNGWVWINMTRLHVNKWFYVGFISLLSVAMFIGQFSMFLPIKIIGYLWLIILGYSLILLPIANLLVSLIKKRSAFWIGWLIVLFFLAIFIVGSYNAWSPVVRTYDVHIEKGPPTNEIKVLMASDLHLGQIVGKKHLQRLVDIASETKPDLILIPGDLIDDYIDPYLNENMGEILGQLQAPLGVFAVSGNHDYYGNDLEKLVTEVESVGVQMLMDEAVLINDQFYLIGRNDLTDDNRKEVAELVRNFDRSKPIIMMDHQPKEFATAEKMGVDLLLSGHTHRGQVAPAHLITSRVFENDWGYLQKGTFHSIVSSGFGTWGPPLRIGSRAEVVIIHLSFDEN
ncbi:metallophosphoesterase [Mesobacillus maritimus]|uniref:metallophosphoesterase n=1 Tax=Mesobacillus maritimus TaxID=1643336 RepID=UPI00203F68CC|nr:metallophosphoesterase [Mesobacillus maritimus]MCM3584150.1 metallophosphoesterase [Mesobacillus maritimus]MCM3669388.1 metallophosphoesterase [Mesobacillus maritimus]